MAVRELYRVEQLPAFQNRIFRTDEEARNCGKGDMVLVRDLETGLIFNDPDEFHRHFLRLTAIPNLAPEPGDNARRMVSRDRISRSGGAADRMVSRLGGTAGGADRSAPDADWRTTITGGMMPREG